MANQANSDNVITNADPGGSELSKSSEEEKRKSSVEREMELYLQQELGRNQPLDLTLNKKNNIPVITVTDDLKQNEENPPILEPTGSPSKTPENTAHASPQSDGRAVPGSRGPSVPGSAAGSISGSVAGSVAGSPPRDSQNGSPRNSCAQENGGAAAHSGSPRHSLSSASSSVGSPSQSQHSYASIVSDILADGTTVASRRYSASSGPEKKLSTDSAAGVDLQASPPQPSTSSTNNASDAESSLPVARPSRSSLGTPSPSRIPGRKSSQVTGAAGPAHPTSPPSVGGGEVSLSEDLRKLESKLEKYIPKDMSDAGSETSDLSDVSQKNGSVMTTSVSSVSSVVNRLHNAQTASTRAKAAELQKQTGSSPPDKNSMTSSMLKSTLRKMTRFSMGKTNKKQVGDENGQAVGQTEVAPPTKTTGTGRTITGRSLTNTHHSPARVSRSKSFKEPEPPMKQNSSGVAAGRNTVYTSSIRRTKHNKHNADNHADSSNNSQFQRSGTGGHLERGSTRRSMSATRTNLSKIVKKSRPVQTDLTRDSANDSVDGVESQPKEGLVHFQVWLPELLGQEGDNVETHITDSNEPVDVRKNRQLTLENMKLQREVERLKAQTTENEMLKKELKNVRNKLDEEQKTRITIQKDLETNHERVKAIMCVMENVEREWENRGDALQEMQNELTNSLDVQSRLEREIRTAEQTVIARNREIDRSMAAQKTLIQQLQESEAEAKELQDFLQAEKNTLSEALKESESESRRLKIELTGKEEQMAKLEEHNALLVRRAELREQELQAARSDLTVLKERARDICLAQGAELSRASIAISQLTCRLEQILLSPSGLESSTGPSSGLEPGTGPASTGGVESGHQSPLPPAGSQPPIGDANSNGIAYAKPNADEDDDASSECESVVSNEPSCPMMAGLTRRSSQFLVTPTDNLEVMSEFSRAVMSASTGSDIFGDVCSSFSSLGNTASERHQSETSPKPGSVSVPSLSDQIIRADGLLVKMIQTFNINTNSSSINNGHRDDACDGEEEGRDVSSRLSDVNLETADLDTVMKALKEKTVTLQQLREELVSKDANLSELKNKYTKHRQILTSNWEQAEVEIKRLDDIYHSTVDQVILTLESSVPDVQSNGRLATLLHNLRQIQADGIEPTTEDGLNGNEDGLNGNKASVNGNNGHSLNQNRNRFPTSSSMSRSLLGQSHFSSTGASTASANLMTRSLLLTSAEQSASRSAIKSSGLSEPCLGRHQANALNSTVVDANNANNNNINSILAASNGQLNGRKSASSEDNGGGLMLYPTSEILAAANGNGHCINGAGGEDLNANQST